MTQKPLSPERREEIIRLVKAYPIMPMDGSAGYLYAIADLLADAAYWRNAVKNADPWNACGPHDVVEYACAHCEVVATDEQAAKAFPKSEVAHQAECPYLLAQR